MAFRRREFLRFATAGVIDARASAASLCLSSADHADRRAVFNVRSFGATGDGKAVDTPAVNRAIAAAAAEEPGRDGRVKASACLSRIGAVLVHPIVVACTGRSASLPGQRGARCITARALE